MAALFFPGTAENRPGRATVALPGLLRISNRRFQEWTARLSQDFSPLQKVSQTKVLAVRGLRSGRKMDTHQSLHRACKLSRSSAGCVVQTRAVRMANASAVQNIFQEAARFLYEDREGAALRRHNRYAGTPVNTTAMPTSARPG